jgi:hypothetical protein
MTTVSKLSCGCRLDVAWAGKCHPKTGFELEAGYYTAMSGRGFGAETRTSASAATWTTAAGKVKCKTVKSVSSCIYCHKFRVTLDGFWIDDRIYWTLWYSAWLHYYTHTLVSTVTSSMPLLGSGFQRRTFPFLWVPELFPASATSF